MSSRSRTRWFSFFAILMLALACLSIVVRNYFYAASCAIFGFYSISEIRRIRSHGEPEEADLRDRRRRVLVLLPIAIALGFAVSLIAESLRH
jgi:hypothetical protein